MNRCSLIKMAVVASVMACSATDHASQDAWSSSPDSTPALDGTTLPPCPSGLGDRFVCDATGASRIRCVDNTVETVSCPNACVAGTGGDDATCSCGSSTGFSRWNCGTDGDLHSCAGGITLLAQSCHGRGCTAMPVGISDTCNSVSGSALQTTLDRLGALCGQYSPGTTCGLAVRDLVSGNEAHHRGNAFYVSASSAKAIWVAAALYDTSIAAVMPYSVPVFRDSDNFASGSVIDLLVSPARVNTFMWNDVGLPDSGFCHWSFGATRNASNCPTVMGGDNFFTADDMVRFVTALWDRSLLGDAKAQAELGWLQLSPRTGYGGWLGTQLPSAAQATMHHKAGWLPPNEVPGYTNSNEIGIVEIPNGHAYGVAILMNGGTDYNNVQLPMMEFASCVIYHAVAADSPNPFSPCTHP